MTQTPPRAIVVGTGFGCRIQVPALRGAGFEVAGLVGQDAARTAERAAQNGVPEAFTNLAEAARRTGATAVAISTPPTRHAAVTLEALGLGLHVLCEKPFAITAAEGRGMLAAAERAGVVAMVGHEFRFDPQRALVARTIAEGAIGEMRFVSLVGYGGYTHDFAKDIPAWWFEPKTSGRGWLGMFGSHVIDQVRSELGDFASVSAAVSRISAKTVDDSFAARFTLTNGAEGVLQNSGGALGPWADFFRVAGSEGTLWTEGRSVFVDDGRGPRELPVPADLQLPPPPPLTDDPRRQSEEWALVTPSEIGPYTRLASRFRGAIEGAPPPPGPQPASFAEGVESIKVIEAIAASAAAGGTVVEIAAG